MADLILEIDPQELQDLILADPVEAALELFGFKCHSEGQKELLRAPFTHRRVECHSGHGVGKTHSYGPLPLLWLLSHPYCYVIMTSSSWTQLQAKPWAQTKDCLYRSKIKISDHEPTDKGLVLDVGWELRLISPDNPIVGHGWHSPGGTLILVDEASDEAYSYDLHEHLKSSAAGPRASMVLTFNPLRIEGPAADAMDSPDWHHVTLSVLESPNVLAREEIVQGMVSHHYVDEIIRDHGIDSYEYTTRVRGEKPTEDQLTVISKHMIREAVKRYNKLQSLDVIGDVVFSGDMALSTAGDYTVFGARDDIKTLLLGDKPIRRIRSDDYDLIEAEAKIAIRECPKPPKTINIDAGGQTALPSRLKNQGYPVYSCQAAAEAHDKEHFVNQRAEATWNARMALINGFAIHPDLGAILEKQAGIQRKPTGSEKIQIESKQDFADRALHGKSPDEMDQFILLFAKRPGISAFTSSLSPCLIPAETKPEVLRLQNLVNGKFEWRIALKGQAREFTEEGVRTRIDRPGGIHRAMWLSRNSESACLWLHVDEPQAWIKDPGGCHVIFDSCVWPVGTGIAEIAGDVARRSRDGNGFWHDYQSDGACGNDTEMFLNSVCEIMQREAKWEAGLGVVPLPCWYPVEEIGGKRGLDVVMDLVQGTLQKREGAMLLSHNARILSELEQVMVKAPKDTEWGAAREELRDSAMVKCLRLFAVSSQPV